MKMNFAQATSIIGLLILLAACHQKPGIVTPEQVGLSGDTLELATQKMHEYVDRGKLAGVATLIMKKGEVVHRDRYGFANIEDQ